MHWHDFHYIRRSDRRALWLLLTIFVVASLVMYFSDATDTTEASLKNREERIKNAETGRYSYVKNGVNGKDYYGKNGYYAKGGYYGKGGYYAVAGRAARRFPFDPNTADSTELLSLGLQPWQVRSIYRYRAAGGVYRRKEDFGRLYGLTNKQYRELAPYIRIGADYKPYVVVNKPRPAHVNVRDSIATKLYPTKLKAGERIDLNASDTAQLMRVPGIGRYYARQIVNRRHWLGGFYSEDQLLEIEYLPKEAINYFYVKPGAVKKLNINKMSLSQLKRHPYLNYYQARDIVEYRRQRGPIKSIKELKMMKDFTNSDLERLKHYIEY